MTTMYVSFKGDPPADEPPPTPRQRVERNIQWLRGCLADLKSRHTEQVRDLEALIRRAEADLAKLEDQE